LANFLLTAAVAIADGASFVSGVNQHRIRNQSGSNVAKCNIQQAFAIAFAFSGCLKDAFSQSRLEHCSLPLRREAAPSLIQNFLQGVDGLEVKKDGLFGYHDTPFMIISWQRLLTRLGDDSLTIG
jgi:hypothetical protein